MWLLSTLQIELFRADGDSENFQTRVYESDSIIRAYVPSSASIRHHCYELFLSVQLFFSIFVHLS